MKGKSIRLEFIFHGESSDQAILVVSSCSEKRIKILDLFLQLLGKNFPDLRNENHGVIHCMVRIFNQEFLLLVIVICNKEFDD